MVRKYHGQLSTTRERAALFGLFTFIALGDCINYCWFAFKTKPVVLRHAQASPQYRTLLEDLVAIQGYGREARSQKQQQDRDREKQAQLKDLAEKYVKR